MNTLRLFYKEEIKKLSKEIRSKKEQSKKIERKISISNDFSFLRESSSLKSELSFLKQKARYLFLAYAIIRSKPIDTVETNPKNKHDPELLQGWIKKMEESWISFK